MRKILVTGANGHLGIAVVKKLLNEQHKVIAVIGKESANGLPDDPNLETWLVDLLDEEKVREFIKTVLEKNPDLNDAVLLVGGFSPGNMEGTSTGQIDKMIQLNFYTAYNMVRNLMPHFKAEAGGGRFIMIGARPPLKPSQGKDLLAYSLSKSLVFRLAEIIHAEGSGANVTATVIVPSTIDTELNRKNMPGADFSSWVPPEKIADTIAFSLSDAGKMLRETVIKIYNRS